MLQRILALRALRPAALSAQSLSRRALTLGIRREDKNIWERRVPLVPDDVRRLLQHAQQAHVPLQVLVEPCPRRVFPAAAFAAVGGAGAKPAARFGHLVL